MTRKNMFVLLSAVIVLTVAAVSVLLGWKPFEITKAMTPPSGIQHVDVKQINPQGTKEIRIAIPSEMENPILDALPDGNSLAVGTIVKYKDGGTVKTTESSKIFAAYYDANGRMLWSKTYSELEDGYVTHAKLLPGGGFIFHYGALQQYEPGQSAPPTEYLVFCNANGEVQKIHSWYTNALVQYLLVTDGGDVYAIGEGVFRDGRLVESPAQSGSSDVSILRFDIMGNQKFSRGFGGSDFDSPTGAAWSPATGLVLTVRSQSKDGDIIIGASSAVKAEASVFLLAAFGDDGSEKWQYLVDEKQAWLPGSLAVLPDGVVAAQESGGKPSLLKLGLDGNRIWKSGLPEKTMALSDTLVRLKDGRLAIAVTTLAEGTTKETGQVIVLDNNGAVSGKTRQLDGRVIKMLPTDDGGVLVVSIQNVKILPAPLYVSSIWFDTVTIVTKLDKNLNVQWRKVYNKYKNSTRQDVAVPLADGRVVVEK